MIHKALIALAVALGFASPALASLATPCSDIVLYGDGIDHPEGVNIRSGPSNGFKIVGITRPQNLYDTAFAVSASQNGWLKVRVIGELGYRTGKLATASGFSGSGWVSAKQLFIRFPAGKSFLLRSAAGSSKGRRFLVELETSGPQRILGCSGSWVRIAHLEDTMNDNDELHSTEYAGWITGRCLPRGPCPFRPSWGKGAEMGSSWPYP